VPARVRSPDRCLIVRKRVDTWTAAGAQPRRRRQQSHPRPAGAAGGSRLSAASPLRPGWGIL